MVHMGLVRVKGEGEGKPREGLLVSELDALYYMVTSMFGYTMKYIECTLCGFLIWIRIGSVSMPIGNTFVPDAVNTSGTLIPQSATQP